MVNFRECKPLPTFNVVILAMFTVTLHVLVKLGYLQLMDLHNSSALRGPEKKEKYHKVNKKYYINYHFPR